MDDTKIREYLRNNLSIEISEDTLGFNGRQIKVSLLLEGEEISEASYTIKNDDD